MALADLIRGSYGSEDGIFAGHPDDQKRAAQSLVAAFNEQVGFEEFLQMHEDYLAGRGLGQEHINRQLEKVKDIKSYFGWD